MAKKQKTVAELGHTYRHIITGFEGVCILKATFLTGCDRAGLQSRDLDNGKPIEVQHFDEPELVEVFEHDVVQYDLEPEPAVQGAAAPSRRGGPGRFDPPSTRVRNY